LHDASVLGEREALLVHVEPTFETMRGTAGEPTTSEKAPVTQEPMGDSAGG
jgi:hypothetical protein